MERYILEDAVNVGTGQRWHTVAQDCGVAPLEEDTQPPQEVGGCLRLVLPRVPCQGSCQLLPPSLCARVPATKGFSDQWQDGNALPPALLLCPICFSPMSMIEGLASCVCCAWHCGSLEGGGDRDIGNSSTMTTSQLC